MRNHRRRERVPIQTILPWTGATFFTVTVRLRTFTMPMTLSSDKFQYDINPTWSWSTNVTDRRTSCNRKTALCTIVHRAVKIINIFWRFNTRRDTTT